MPGALAQFLFQRQASVPSNHLDLSGTLGQESKVFIGQAFHFRVNLIKIKPVTSSTVGGQGTNAQSDDGNLDWPIREILLHHQANATVFVVVSGRQQLSVQIRELDSMQGSSMKEIQLIVVRLLLASLANHSQDTKKVPPGSDGLAMDLMDRIKGRYVSLVLG